MSLLIELDSATANHRTIHFRLFTSNGTAPDTGASGDSVIVARGSATTFTPDVLVTAVHAAQGMYSVQLTQSNVSNLGQHAIYHTQGDFPQHVANFCVVNSNPYSTQSNLDLPTAAVAEIAGASADSVWDEARADHTTAGTYGLYVHSNVSLWRESGSVPLALSSGRVVSRVEDMSTGVITADVIATGAIDADALATSGIAEIAGASADSVWDEARADHVAAGTFGLFVHSNVTQWREATPNALISGRVDANAQVVGDKLDYNIATIDANAIDATAIASGAITAAKFAASAIDAAALATDAGQEIADRMLVRAIAGGADSGRTVGEALMSLRNRVLIGASTMTVYQADDTTAQWTASFSTAAFPLGGVDPA